MSPDGFIGEPMFKQNALEQAKRQRRAIRQVASSIQTGDFVLVHDFHPEAGTVDVVKKNDPEMLPMKGVPIAGISPSDGFAVYPPIHTIVESETDPSVKPTIGWVAFPRDESSEALLDHRRTLGKVQVKHQPTSGLFYFGAQATNDTPSARFTQHYQSGDLFIEGPGGSIFIMRENGDVVISAAGSLTLAGNGDTTGAKAARQGDAGDGTGGSIAGGSNNVFIGD